MLLRVFCNNHNFNILKIHHFPLLQIIIQIKTMKFLQIRQISTMKTPKWNPIPIPFNTIQEPKGQDLDYINITHSHLLHNDFTKLDQLLPNFDSFKVKHTLLKIQHNYSLSFKFFKWVLLKRPSLLNPESNFIIIHVLTKNRKFVSAEYVLKQVLNSCDFDMCEKVFDGVLCTYRMCDSSPRVFDALFKVFAEMKQFRNASYTFRRMREYGFVPNVESCNLYMSGLLSMNRGSVVLSFYKEMTRARIVVNVFTVNMVINAYCQLGKLEDAVRVFDEMKDMGFSPLASTYNTLIAAYGGQGHVSVGMKLKDTMEKNGVKPNVVTYNTLIYGYCKEGKLHEAFKVFHEMKRVNVGPNTVTYNTLISWCSQMGKTEKGNQIFEEMMRNGMKADILTYNALLSGLCNEGKTRKAAYLVKELDKKKLVPNASTFAALIRGQCARKNPERGFQLYKSMIKSGCRPNEDTVKMLMSSFVQNDDYDGAFCVFKEMLERPVGPDSAVLGELCKGFSEVWKDRLVKDLLRVVDEGCLELGRYEKVKGIIFQSNHEGKDIE